MACWESLDEGSQVVERVASRDMTRAVISRGHIDEALRGVSRVSAEMSQMLGGIAEQVGVMTRALQFEDIVRQLLGGVVERLGVYQELCENIVDSALLRKVLSGVLDEDALRQGFFEITSGESSSATIGSCRECRIILRNHASAQGVEMSAVRVQRSNDNRTATVSIQGTFDFGCRHDFKKAYTGECLKMSEYVIDFRQTEYLDSAALGMLLQLHEHASKIGARVRLINLSGLPQKVISIASFDEIFEIAA